MAPVWLDCCGFSAALVGMDGIVWVLLVSGMILGCSRLMKLG